MGAVGATQVVTHHSHRGEGLKPELGIFLLILSHPPPSATWETVSEVALGGVGDEIEKVNI